MKRLFASALTISMLLSGCAGSSMATTTSTDKDSESSSGIAISEGESNTGIGSTEGESNTGIGNTEGKSNTSLENTENESDISIVDPEGEGNSSAHISETDIVWAIKTQQEYDQDMNILAEREYEYDPRGNVIRTRYMHTEYNTDRVSDLTYDDDNYLIKIVDSSIDGSGYLSSQEYQYDSEHRIIKICYDNASLKETRNNSFNDEGRLLHCDSIGVDGVAYRTFDFKYDQNGNCVSAEGTMGAVDYKFEAEYIDKDKPVSMSLSYGDYTISNIIKYDDQKRILQELRTFDDTKIQKDYTYSADSYQVVETTTDEAGERVIEYKYDLEGILLLKKEYHKNEEGEDSLDYAFYDKSGNVIESVSYYDGELFTRHLYEYNESGMLVLLKLEYPNEQYSRILTTEYEYNENGQQTRVIDKKNDETDYETIFKYDSHGSLETKYTSSNGKIYVDVLNTLDEYGNILISQVYDEHKEEYCYYEYTYVPLDKNQLSDMYVPVDSENAFSYISEEDLYINIYEMKDYLGINLAYLL